MAHFVQYVGGFILHTKGMVKFIPQLLEQRNASYEFFFPLKLKLDFSLTQPMSLAW